MTVLLIEDSDTYAQVIIRLLEGLADKVILAKNWAEAETYLGIKPDLAWVDLALPDMLPSQTVLKVAEVREHNTDMVIVVVSGHLTPEARQLFSAGTVDAVMEKIGIMDRMKIASFIYSALMRANDRGAKGAAELLKKTAEFMAKNFPDALESAATI